MNAPTRDELAAEAIRRISVNPLTRNLPATAASAAATIVVNLCCDEFAAQLDHVDAALSRLEAGQVAAELAAGAVDRERYERPEGRPWSPSPAVDTTTPVGGVRGDE